MQRADKVIEEREVAFKWSENSDVFDEERVHHSHDDRSDVDSQLGCSWGAIEEQFKVLATSVEDAWRLKLPLSICTISETEKKKRETNICKT